MKKRENIAGIVIIILVILLLIGLGVGILYFVRNLPGETPGTQPGTSAPTLTQPGTQPSGTTVPSEPTEATQEPTTRPTEPAPTEPEPTEPAPTEPAPTEPQPTEPLPTEPEFTEPPETEPEPCQHRFDEWFVKEPATCTEAGEYYRICFECGQGEYDPIPATGHSYGAWKTTKEATCTDKGTKVRTCANCGDEESKTVSATGHSYDSGTPIGDAASCVETGGVRYTCVSCGHSYDVTQRGSHDLSYNESGGYWVCALCEERFYDEYSAEKDDFIPIDADSAMMKDTVTLKEKSYTGKLSTWSDKWFEYRMVIYHCMMGHSESYNYGSGPEYPYEHRIRKDCTKEEAEAVRDEFILFLDDFEDVFGWRPDAPTVEYSNHYKGYCLFFDLKEMYSDYRSQIKKLSDERIEEIEMEVTAYLVHSWGVYDGMSVYNASCLISGSVWNWAYYDYSYRLHDAIDGFALGSCVCDGYAKMFMRFADYCGIDAEIVTGKQNGVGHAWNKVTFSDGTVRYIDLTNSTELRRVDNMESYKW